MAIDMVLQQLHVSHNCMCVHRHIHVFRVSFNNVLSVSGFVWVLVHFATVLLSLMIVTRQLCHLCLCCELFNCSQRSDDLVLDVFLEGCPELCLSYRRKKCSYSCQINFHVVSFDTVWSTWPVVLHPHRHSQIVPKAEGPYARHLHDDLLKFPPEAMLPRSRLAKLE